MKCYTYFPEILYFYFEDNWEKSYSLTDIKPSQSHIIYHQTESDLLAPKYIVSGKYGDVSKFQDIFYAVYIEKDTIGDYFIL